MIKEVTKEQIEALTGRPVNELSLRVVNEQATNAAKLATDWPEYTDFLTGAEWVFKGVYKSVDGRNPKVEFTSFRFESVSDPVVTQIVDVLDASLYQSGDLVTSA
jgi:hypothetical protein